MGTPFYMSPEQVRGIEVDRRSDIYSLGIIAYEMAAGSPPFTEGSAFEIMMKRMQQPPRPLAELKPELPAYLRSVIDRCLAVDPAARYQSCEEILADLGSETATQGPVARAAPPLGRRPLLIAGGVVLALALAGGFGWRLRSAPGRRPHRRRPVGPGRRLREPHRGPRPRRHRGVGLRPRPRRGLVPQPLQPRLGAPPRRAAAAGGHAGSTRPSPDSWPCARGSTW